MSVPYIEMRCDLHDDARVQSVAAGCKVHIDHVIGALRRLWGRAYIAGKRRGKDIVLSGWTPAAFEAACGVPGIHEALTAQDWASTTTEGWVVMVRGAEKFKLLARERGAEYEATRKRNWRAKSPGHLPPKSGTKGANVPNVPPLAEHSKAQQSAATAYLSAEDQSTAEHAAAAGADGGAPEAEGVVRASRIAVAACDAQDPEAARFSLRRRLLLGGVNPDQVDTLMVHRNATPERLGWLLGRVEASRPKNPGGWITRGVTEGWRPDSPAASKANADLAELRRKKGVPA